MSLTAKNGRQIYKTMFTIRRFEEEASRLLKEGKLPGFIHLSIGQEAVPSTICHVIRQEDYITSTHRGHGHCIAKGGDLKLMMAELFGKKTGFSGGTGGSMHIADVEKGILGANGIVGAGLPIATGAGYSILTRGTDQVVICFFGDGAANEGAFHESLNIAALWKLPVIFVCENNGYAEMTPQSIHRSGESIYQRGIVYGIPSESIDGRNVTELFAASQRAILRARNQKGPTLLEVQVDRWKGHFEGDNQSYRMKEELENMYRNDPIILFKQFMLESNFANKEWFEETLRSVNQKLDEAIHFAESSPEPNLNDMLSSVYV